MANIDKLVICITLLLSSFSMTALSKRSSESSSSSDITWWCNLTPHPDPCNHYMRQSQHNFKPNHRSKFVTMLVQLALERAFSSKIQATEYRRKSQCKEQKAALADCLKLYDQTIFHLNRTLYGLRTKKWCSSFDAQTWLSTALTNVETCRAGALDLNVTEFIEPLVQTNVSQLISNSLAVNSVFLKGLKNQTTDDFPSWLTTQERRLLLDRSIKPHLVVAKDGSGHFRTVQAALDVAEKRRYPGRFIIYVKRGIYVENIEVSKNNNDVMLVGDGVRFTVITSSRSVQGGFTTYSSATAGIDGLHFIARDITFINSAGSKMGQAVALRSASDLSVFYRCSFQGYQDTLMVHSQRQFYRECYIYGTIDFIFGNAAVVFQNCMIFVRRPSLGQANVITAQGRGDPYQNTGITIQNSQIRAAPDLLPVIRTTRTYLGRPWQQYARVVVIKSYLDHLISPLGWSKWGNTDFALTTLYFGEYMNIGPGSSTKWRVRWRGFHKIRRGTEAYPFTVSGLLAGRAWLPASGVPFISGL